MTTARGSWSDTTCSSMLIAPRSAFTGRLRSSVIVFGSAKKARKSTEGASTTSNGLTAGTSPPKGRGARDLGAHVRLHHLERCVREVLVDVGDRVTRNC